MKPPSEKQAVSEIVELLAELFCSSPKALQVQHVGAAERYDYAISVAGHRFIVEYKISATATGTTMFFSGCNRS